MNNTTEEIVELFLTELRAGRPPCIEHFAAQYPEHREMLLEVLPTVAKMAECKRGFEPEMMRKYGLSMPDTIGKEYKILRKIGQGGMGTVYEAVQLSLDRKVALKVLDVTFCRDPLFLRQFEQEAKLIARLHHPNIVDIYGAGHTDRWSYYCMELIDGEKIHIGAHFSCRTVAELGIQAASALAYAHNFGILHRDIKPSNLLLDKHGNLRVGDFGLASSFTDIANEETFPHSRSGTLRYMAPERLLEGKDSPAADQYSLGVTLYEMLTGTAARTENLSSLYLLYRKKETLPSLSGNAAIDPDLAAIIEKTIAFNPSERYKNMEALVDDLQCYLRHEPVPAAFTIPAKHLHLWMKRSPAAVFLLFLLFLLCGTLLVSFILIYCNFPAV